MSFNVYQRANNSSNLYAAIKSRSSNSGSAGCPFLYSKEVNQCQQYRHTVKVTPNNSPGFDRTIRFDLPNYGFLEHMFLETEVTSRFNTAANPTVTAVGTDQPALAFGFGAYVFDTVRLIFRGQTVAELDSEYIMARFLQDMDKERVQNFQTMVGGFPAGTANTAAGAEAHWDATGRNLLSINKPENQGKHKYYCPLPFWFCETTSRALDLSILHSALTVEIDVRPAAKLTSVVGRGSDDTAADPGYVQASQLANDKLQMSLQCHIAELPAEEVKMYRGVTYKPGSTPHSQLGYDIVKSVYSLDATQTKHTIKLNDFSGLVQRLYIIPVLSTARTANLYMKNRYTIAGGTTNELQFKTVRLKSVDQELYEREDNGVCAIRGRYFLEDYDVAPSIITKQHLTGPVLMDRYLQNSASLFESDRIIDDEDIGARVRAAGVATINFKTDWDIRSSATGSLSFGTVHNPTLELEFESQPSANEGTTVDIVIFAEVNNIMLYETNSAGATGLRRLIG